VTAPLPAVTGLVLALPALDGSTALAFVGALAVGLSLGLMGSGGSILTVPVLVYVLGQQEKVAVAGSLFIVGTISAVAAIPYAVRRQVSWRSVLAFAPPGMAGTWLGAWLSRFLSGELQLGVFSLVLLAAAVLMLRSPGARAGRERPPRAWWKIAIDGLFVGVVTGIAGVGGGFLIVPALVLLGGLEMRLASGTSLVIIALKSATGFAKYLDVLAEEGLELDWSVLGVFAGVGIVGSLTGSWLSALIPQGALRRAFAVLLVVVGAWILISTVRTL